MRIGCAETERDGVAGVAVYVADNGVGFETATNGLGKDLASIRPRANSLHGALTRKSSIAAGTKIVLWLPYARAI